MSVVVQRLWVLCLCCAALPAWSADPRIDDEFRERSPVVNPLKQALGEKEYNEAISSGEYRYIGNRKCRLCHRDFYNGRKKDRHFHTFKKIVQSGHSTKPRCLGCHTTGYGVPSGFRDEKSTAALAGVQCEGCHGPGNRHMRLNDGGGFLAGVDRPEVLKRMCNACHTRRWNRAYENFDKAYDSYVTAKPGDEKKSYLSY